MPSPLSVTNIVRDARFLMGTLIEITAYWSDSSQATICDNRTAVIQQAMAKIEQLERICNIFDADSELSYVNRMAAQRPVKISSLLCNVLKSALDYTMASQHIFSVLLLPVIQIWQRSIAQNHTPNSAMLRKALSLNNANLIALDLAKQTIYFRQAGVKIDLGGYAKGYAVDCAQAIMQAGGIASAMINAGNSSIAVWGRPPTTTTWQLAVRHVAGEEALLGIISLTAGSLSTSGTYEKGFFLADQYYSHLLDSRTGSPLSQPTAATIVAKSAAEAEVISKLATVLNCQYAAEIADNNRWSLMGILHQTIDKQENLHLEHTDDLTFMLLDDSSNTLPF